MRLVSGMGITIWGGAGNDKFHGGSVSDYLYGEDGNDTIDGGSSKRPYRQKISTGEAVKYLREQSGILFDPKIVTIFERLVEEQKIDSTPSE